MKQYSEHFNKTNLKKEYMKGAIWLLEHGFSPRGFWPVAEFYGTFKTSQSGYENFLITAEYSNNVGWSLTLGESQYGNVLAVGDSETGNSPLPVFKGETLDKALDSLDDFIMKERRAYRLLIMKKDRLYK